MSTRIALKQPSTHTQTVMYPSSDTRFADPAIARLVPSQARFHQCLVNLESQVTPDMKKRIEDATAALKTGSLKACDEDQFGGCKK